MHARYRHTPPQQKQMPVLSNASSLMSPAVHQKWTFARCYIKKWIEIDALSAKSNSLYIYTLDGMDMSCCLRRQIESACFISGKLSKKLRVCPIPKTMLEPSEKCLKQSQKEEQFS
jgi:hypothetical protein